MALRTKGHARGTKQGPVLGIFGDPVHHSLSPAMHNAALRAAGLGGAYLAFRVAPEELPQALGSVRRLALRGVNLTVPHKEAAIPLLERLTPAARRCGSVNTVLRSRNGMLVGDNTDAAGFMAALAASGARGGCGRAVVIGAGGAARAVVSALAQGGWQELVVANRTPERAEALLATLGAGGARAVSLAALTERHLLEGASVVVNCTPVGLHGERYFPLAYRASQPACLFVDLIYAARPTPFLAPALRLGRRTLDGSAMLLLQGALAFSRFTGRAAPLGAMARALEEAGLGRGTLTRLARSPRLAETALGAALRPR